MGLARGGRGDARRAAGDIVNMASMSSFGPVPGLAVYGATKHAVLGFTESLQGDLDDAGIPIRMHAICPDGVDTGMVRERQADDGRGDHLLRAPAPAAPRRSPSRSWPLIGERRSCEAIPRSRGWLVRTMALFPRLSLRLLPLFTRRRVSSAAQLKAADRSRARRIAAIECERVDGLRTV